MPEPAIRVPSRADGAGLSASVHPSRLPGPRGGRGDHLRIYRIRRDRRQPSRRQPGADHASAAACNRPATSPSCCSAAARRASAIRRGATRRGRCLPTMYRKEPALHTGDIRVVPDIRRRAVRRRNGGQCGLADGNRLSRLSADYAGLLGQAMLAADSVKRRLEREQPLSFLEFNYMVLQAYDFLELARRRGCVLQMGGSDQWGNIVAGVELARRVEGRALYGLTGAADRHGFGRQDGQDGGGGRLAQRRPPSGLRLLAVLAQRRGWRCGSLFCGCSPIFPWRRSRGSRR